MEIKKINFTWRNPLMPLDRDKIDGIALHHMHHPTADIREVEKWHLANDNGTWKGFGYGWWIDFNGNIYEGRGYNQNAGVANHNDHVLSIGFQGGYEPTDKFECNKEMPIAQYNAGVWLLRKIRKEVPTIKIINGHNYWNATSCPGKYFPLDKMIKDAFKDEVEKEQINWQEILRKVADDPSGWEIAINALVLASESGMMNSIYKHLPLLIEKVYNKH